MQTDDEFLCELRATFKIEAGEHLQTLSSGLLELEATDPGPARAVVVETIFRAAHSLKGAARVVELGDIESVCQLLEDVLAKLRRDASATLSAEAVDLLHRALDAIVGLIPAGGDSSPPRLTGAKLAALGNELRCLANLLAAPSHAQAEAGAKVSPAEPFIKPAGASTIDVPAAALPAAEPNTSTPASASAPASASTQIAPAEGTVRVALPRLEAQLLQTEELLSVKLALGARVAELRQLSEWFDVWRKRWNGVEIDARMMRRVPQQTNSQAATSPATAGAGRVVDFYDWSDGAVRMLESRLSEIGRAARRDHELVNRLVDGALDNAKQLLLLPFLTLCASLPKLVRDLCRAEGKEADLSITGEHVVMDKRILEELKDPLVHMLRNAVDHAIEPPDQRVRAGKPQRATLELSVAQLDGNRVQIMLADDGAGIDVQRVRAAAVRDGVLSEAQAAQLDDAAAQALIFRSGLSTGTAVTPLSGRGLGLAIVQEHAQRLGGSVQVDSTPGQGTRFRIIVSATRATFRGILCEAAGRQFVVPATAVERVACLRPDALRSIEGREAVCIGERVMALVRLAEVLGLDTASVAAKPEGAGWQVVVLGGGSEQAVAFAVDAVIEECEVLVKPLRKPLLRVSNVAAAAVMGAGVLVPVLNAADLLQSARHVRGRAPVRPPNPAQARQKNVLVAEDSITSRLLLKSILQSAGYAVKTAVDGAEALAMLRTEPFDLLVSDVEMPRLNGFDLTARVRSDKKLAELPVILVTALAAREDKERGIDVGANAYIVKGSFGQDNLLASVGRLIG